MKETIRICYTREYRCVGIIAFAKERIVRLDDLVSIRWGITFRKLLAKGIWCKQIADLLEIGLVEKCKDKNSATLKMEHYHDGKVDKYEVYHDENEVLVYHNQKLINNLPHALRTI